MHTAPTLQSRLFDAMTNIAWFESCGQDGLDSLPDHTMLIDDRNDAIQRALSQEWKDIRTEAQGNLTGYLAKHHPYAYRYWNKLATQSRAKMIEDVMPIVHERLNVISAAQLSEQVLLDLNRISLYFSYHEISHKIPDFFYSLFKVYASGHLPCNWSSSLDVWPDGSFIVY